MDYNDNNNNLNYYPTFDYPSTNPLPQPYTQIYNDNSLNPPSTSYDVTRNYISRDSHDLNINEQPLNPLTNIINEEHITNLNIVNQQ
jgi:hypothetical protein